jgi:hypothetical protein
MRVGSNIRRYGKAVIGLIATISLASCTPSSPTSSDASENNPTVPPGSSTPVTLSPTTTEEPRRSGAGLIAPLEEEPLSVGDCYTVSNRNTAVRIDCYRLHDGQVVQRSASIEGLSPNETDLNVWKWIVTATCTPTFETFTGNPISQSPEFAVDAILTSATKSPAEAACVAVSADGELWAGTAKMSIGAYVGIEVGDCFDFPTETRNAVELPCDEPHEGEMYVVEEPLRINAWDAPYPDVDQWAAIAAAICDKPFGEYTGVDIEESVDLSYSYLFTLEADWADLTQRTLSCAVVSENGTRRTSTARG